MTTFYTLLSVHCMTVSCSVAVVGGGPGGLYSAWRLMNGTNLNGTVCLFEASTQFGGRIITLHEEGLTAEAGAYRYARHLTLDNQDTTCV